MAHGLMDFDTFEINSLSFAQAAALCANMSKFCVTQDWYEGIPRITLDPDVSQIDASIPEDGFEMSHLYMFTKDQPDLDVTVGFWVEVMGVQPTLTKAKSLTARGNGIGGCTHTFFHAASRMHFLSDYSSWCVSQATYIRHTKFNGMIRLGTGQSQNYSSGGFASDISADVIDFDVQQQFLLRSSRANAIVAKEASWNIVTVGLELPPDVNIENNRYQMHIPEVKQGTRPRPYIVFDETRPKFTQWRIIVKGAYQSLSGFSNFDEIPTLHDLDMNRDCVTARVPIGKTSMVLSQTEHFSHGCLILPPGSYDVLEPITINTANFVLFGLAYPMINCAVTGPCVTIGPQAEQSNIINVVFNARSGDMNTPTKAMLLIQAHHVYAYDIFATWWATQAFPGPYRADIGFQFDGDNIFVDDTWVWHADHDSCPQLTAAESLTLAQGLFQQQTFVPNSPRRVQPLPVHPYFTQTLEEIHRQRLDAVGFFRLNTNLFAEAGKAKYQSDLFVSRRGMVWNGRYGVIYNMMVEHILGDQVEVNGGNLTIYMLQNELPYYRMPSGNTILDSNAVIYVKNSGAGFTGYGLGAYIVNPLWVGGYTSYTALNTFQFETNEIILNKAFSWINVAGGNIIDNTILINGAQYHRNDPTYTMGSAKYYFVHPTIPFSANSYEGQLSFTSRDGPLSGVATLKFVALSVTKTNFGGVSPSGHNIVGGGDFAEVSDNDDCGEILTGSRSRARMVISSNNVETGRGCQMRIDNMTSVLNLGLITFTMGSDMSDGGDLAFLQDRKHAIETLQNDDNKAIFSTMSDRVHAVWTHAVVPESDLINNAFRTVPLITPFSCGNITYIVTVVWPTTHTADVIFEYERSNSSCQDWLFLKFDANATNGTSAWDSLMLTAEDHRMKYFPQQLYSSNYTACGTGNWPNSNDDCAYILLEHHKPVTVASGPIGFSPAKKLPPPQWIARFNTTLSE